MRKIAAELIGRAVQDSEFRRRLLADPRATATEAGFDLDEDQVKALEDLDPDAIEVAIEAMIGETDTAKYG